jgi:hypothetical protein
VTRRPRHHLAPVPIAHHPADIFARNPGQGRQIAVGDLVADHDAPRIIGFAKILPKLYQGARHARPDPSQIASSLTPREAEITRLVSQGLRNKEIARDQSRQRPELGPDQGHREYSPPYNTEFTLDNNDALLIIEQNDYTVAGETYQIQGIQIMQSANGLTGDAINLNGLTGANGGSSATSNLTAWDPADNDVLKIVEIGFVQSTSGTIDANLDFAFQIADGDADTTSTQHLPVHISNDFIV